jgi:ribonuclease PH
VIDLEKLGATHHLGGLRRAAGRRRHAHGGHHRRLRGACRIAIRRLIAAGRLTESPIRHAVAAVSVGIVNGRPLLDLCYTEDVAAAVDMNLVMNSAGEFIELQGTGEEATFTEPQLADLLALGKAGIRELLAAQEKALAAA